MLYIQSNVNQLLKSWNLNILLLSYFLAYEIYSILKFKKKKKKLIIVQTFPIVYANLGKNNFFRERVKTKSTLYEIFS